MKKRIVSLTMVLALCLMLLPTSAFAAEDSGAAIGTGGLCAHHTEHDDTCGYVEGIAESPCTHEHSGDCYTEVTSCTHEHTRECYPASDSSIPEDGTTSSEDEPVLHEAAEPTACSHVCSVESGCIKQELDCKHEHDEKCGYAPAVEGQPCTYVCTQCGNTIIRTSAHTHNWKYEKVDQSTGSVTCTGTTGTCDYQNDSATVTISTDQKVYDCAQIKEAPKAELTYSNNWPTDLAKAEQSDIKYWKSTDDGSTYLSPVTDNNDLMKPGKYVAELEFIKGKKWLEAYFSVVDNRKTDPKYTAPTANPGLTYNGKEQILIIKGHTEDGTMQYRLDNGTYSTTSPTAVNAGRYTIYYKVEG